MKNASKKDIVSVFLIIILVLAAIILSSKSYSLKTFESLSYKNAMTTSYKVYLDDNSYYNSAYLEEGMQYISNIIDYIDVTFNYTTSFADNFEYNVETKAEAIITIVDSDNNDKVIYKNSEILQNTEKTSDNGSSINKTKSFKIDYSKYNRITNEFKTKYGISADCKLRINYYVEYNGEYNGLTNISKSKVMYLDIPLSEQMINIEKSNADTSSGSFDGMSSNTTTNLVLYVVAIVLSFMALFVLIELVYRKKNAYKKISKYDRFINKILKQYDSYITEAERETSNKQNIVKIRTFKELLDVRNNTNKTIVYIKIDEETSRFEINDGDTLYYYIARKTDF